MLAKFSVKKPFTVLVAVILIILLGVVAFLRMTPDLLPNIDLPYVVVVTSYVGASPEEVEQVITKPVEQQMATLDHIKSVDSTSSENYSMVVLQFADEADMDATAMNIREKLDLLKNGWNEYVGTPSILKLNPDMLPLAVAAVSRTGEDSVALTKFYNDTLAPRLEGVEGVASVSASGLISETVDVTVRQEKLDAMNEKIRAAIDWEFLDGEQALIDAEKELDDGYAEIADNQKEIDKGRSKLSSARRELEDQISSANAELNAGAAALAQARLGVVNDMAAVDAQLAPLNARRSQLVSAQSKAHDLSSDIAELAGRIGRANAALGISDPAQQAAALAALGYADAAAASQAVSDMQTEKSSKELVLSGLVDAAGMAVDDMPAAIAQLDAACGPLNDYRNALKAALADIDAKKGDVDGALSSLEAKRSEASSKLSSAKKKLNEGETALADAKTQLDDAKTQLDESKEQLAEAKQNAYDGADLGNILTLSSVGAILGAQNFSMPAGYASGDGRDWLIYVGDKFEDGAEMRDLVLFDLGIGELAPIRLSDVADVRVTDNAADTYARIDGTPGVLLSFNKQSGFATATVSENLAKEFDMLSAEFPGLAFTSLMDQGDYIRLVIDSVLNNLLVGALLAVLILLLFLRDLRPTFIVACSIPISVTFAIVLMYFSGVTLNIISMSGLAVGVGMLVDNSIVVIENIYRLRKSGVSANRAAISGAVQVTGAITASTLTTVCVFVPIVFIQGLTRQLFADMALTIAYSLLASLVIALTLVPALSSGVLRKTKADPDKKRSRLMGGYLAALGFALRHKLLCFSLALLLLAGSLSAALARGFTYMPDMDSTEIMVSVTLDDDAPLSQTAAVTDEVVSRIRTIPDVETVGAMAAQGLGSMVGLSSGGGAVNEATIYAVLRADKSASSFAIAQQIETLCEGMPCTVSASGAGGMSGYSSVLTGSGVSIDIYGDDLDLLRQTARDVAARLAAVDGVAEVSDGLGTTAPALRVTVDKTKAMLEGLTVAQVYQSLAAYLKTDASVTTVEATDQDVVVRMREAAPSVADIRKYELTFQKKDGAYKTVRLSDIASFAETETLQSISRSGQRRYLSVTGTLKEGRNVTLVTEDAVRALADYVPPEGFTVSFAGENETIMSAMNDLMLMLLLGVAIVYLIMVAQFQSLLSPLIVMLTIPLAFTGGLIALLIGGFEISIVAMIGFIMLVGIIVNNGIVLIDAMNQLRAGGMERREAIAEASATRLRPVLMTALTTILGLVPLGFGVGLGAGLVQPVAVVSIGGLVYATLMTLFIVPAMYDIVAKRPPRVVTREDTELVQE